MMNIIRTIIDRCKITNIANAQLIPRLTTGLIILVVTISCTTPQNSSNMLIICPATGDDLANKVLKPQEIVLNISSNTDDLFCPFYETAQPSELVSKKGLGIEYLANHFSRLFFEFGGVYFEVDNNNRMIMHIKLKSYDQRTPNISKLEALINSAYGNSISSIYEVELDRVYLNADSPYKGMIYFEVKRGVIVNSHEMDIGSFLTDVINKTYILYSKSSNTKTETTFDRTEVLFEPAEIPYILLRRWKDRLMSALKISGMLVENQITDTVTDCSKLYNEDGSLNFDYYNDTVKIENINFDFKEEKLVLVSPCPEATADRVQKIIHDIQIPNDFIDIQKTNLSELNRNN